MMGVPFEARPAVRVGLIGVGSHGQRRLSQLLHLEHVEIRAVCDANPKHLAEVAEVLRAGGRAEAAAYGPDPEAFRALCARGDLDLVFIDTPWDWHVPMALAALEGGAHVGLEVPAALTLEGCWALVEASERTRRHCLMLQNTCYGELELALLQMVKAGVFGDLTHAEGGYLHDLRSMMFQTHGIGLWRRRAHETLDGNHYPTHGLGPLCWYFGIHAGDRLARLVSLSSTERSLSRYRDALPEEDPRRRERYVCGDVSTSILQTEQGRTILLQHDAVSPQPYSRMTKVVGSRGSFADYPPRIWQDGLAEGKPVWQEAGLWMERFRHPLWRETEALRRRLDDAPHSMDIVMLHRLVQGLREGLEPDFNVYDAAAWSAPVALSAASAAQGGMPQDFPDFTRGQWQRKPWGARG